MSAAAINLILEKVSSTRSWLPVKAHLRILQLFLVARDQQAFCTSTAVIPRMRSISC